MLIFGIFDTLKPKKQAYHQKGYSNAYLLHILTFWFKCVKNVILRLENPKFGVFS